MKPTHYIAWVALATGCYTGTDRAGGAAPDAPPGVESETGGSDTGSDTTDDEPAGLNCEGAGAVAAAPLRRLTRWELDNTIRDLFGDDSRPASRMLPRDAVPGAFDNLAASQNASLLLVDGYMRVAEEVAAGVDLDALVGCDPADAGCPRAFIETLGRRVFRRPLTEEEVDSLLAVSDASGDFGFRAVIEAMLQSPSFLYRPEFGVPDDEGDGVTLLDDYELATRLSYFLLGTTPDEELLAAAEAGALTSGDLRAQAERLLGEPGARASMTHFAAQWLGIAELPEAVKDPATYPEFDAELGGQMRDDTLDFFEQVVFDGDGTLAALLTSEGTGFLTQPALMTAHGSASAAPVGRGEFVWTQLLCGNDLEAPPDVDTELPDVDPNATTRERLLQHTQLPACAACHAVLDTIGFGFEHYDGIGDWRDTERGQPIDASGSIVGEGEFDDAAGLATLLANSETVHSCFVETAFAFALARPADNDNEPCTIDELQEQFASSDGDVVALLLAVVESDAFRARPDP